MAESDKTKAIADWKVLKPLRDAARTRRGIFGIPADEQEPYLKAMSEARAKLAQPKSPAMPLLTNTAASPSFGWNAKPSPSRSHQEHIAPKGFSSEEWFSCVHTPVPIPKAM